MCKTFMYTIHRLKLRLDAVLAGMKELLAHLLETYANHQREQEAHRYVCVCLYVRDLM